MNPQKRQFWIDEILSLIKKGYSNSYIETLLKSQKVMLSLIPDLISEAENKMFSEILTDKVSIVALHVSRYNKIIEDLLAIEELDYSDICSYINDKGDLVDGTITYEQWKRSRVHRIQALNEAMNSMIQKENLLALFNQDVQVEVIDDVTINLLKKKHPLYDLDKLTTEEQTELYYLMKKIKGTDVQPPDVTYAPVEESQTVGEETKTEQPANIDLIQHEKRSPAPTPATGNGKLQLELKKLAARKLRDAGANLDEEEKKLLDD